MQLFIPFIFKRIDQQTRTGKLHSYNMFTIGHSTRSIEEFTLLLRENKVKLMGDVRRFPGSKKYPHFNKEALLKSLEAAGIIYAHFPELGGRRQPAKNSPNNAWRNNAFRGYADYMETPEFKTAVNKLLAAGDEKHTAIMCSEAVWWRCHRSMISDYLKSLGIEVFHIMAEGKIQIHPYTAPAKIIDGKLTYRAAEGLF